MSSGRNSGEIGTTIGARLSPRSGTMTRRSTCTPTRSGRVTPIACGFAPVSAQLRPRDLPDLLPPLLAVPPELLEPLLEVFEPAWPSGRFGIGVVPARLPLGAPPPPAPPGVPPGAPAGPPAVP